MKLLADFLPILLFFVAYKFSGIFVATAVAIAVSVGQVAWAWFRHGKVERMPLVTAGLMVVLGGATLAFHDDTFVRWKPTAVNWVFALVFVGSQFIGGQPLIRRMLGANLELPEAVWRKLNLAWASFFAAMGVANLYVAFNFDTDTWVNFKLFGMMGLTLAFVLAQAVYLTRHVKADTKEQ